MPPVIDAVECFVFRAPLEVPVKVAFGAMTNRPAVFLRVAASDGAWGWGEVFSNFPQVGAEHRARLVQSIFAPLLKGVPCDPAETYAMLGRRTRSFAIQCGEPGPFAQITAAVDQALWDMSARRTGVALWRLLGGASGRVKVYASGLGPDDVVEHATRKHAEGFRAFKLKVGFGRERDLGNLRDMRAALGAGTPIMTDANQAWEPADALDRIRELAAFDPHWIEEPIRADEPLAAWRDIANASPIPIAAGENIRGLDAFVAAMEHGGLRIVQPDVGKWGGITAGREVAARTAQLGATCCPHWLAGGVGLATTLHFVAACGTPASYAEVDANPNPLREEVCSLALDGGAVTLDDAPGLGVEPDLGALRRFLVLSV
jgi:D-galactarolactone cycloisomerase